MIEVHSAQVLEMLVQIECHRSVQDLQGLNALYPTKYVYVIMSEMCPNCATRKIQGYNCCKTMENTSFYVKVSITSFPTTIGYSETFIVKFCATFPMLLHGFPFQTEAPPNSTHDVLFYSVLFANTEFCRKINFNIMVNTNMI